MNFDEYILLHSDPEPDYLAEINRNTHVRMINPRMCSGHYQGRVLSMFCKMIRPQKVLEIGTYTGYSALCIAESLPKDGVLHTIEIDDELEDFILENFQKSPFADRIKLHIGRALDIISNLEETFDLAFIDGDKREYIDCFEKILPKINDGGYIIADNTLWDGKVLTNSLRDNDKQTIEMIHFNQKISKDKRIERIMLPVRDGLTIIRKI
ncbi:MAG: O-methyltransferase [Paludibacteraceae bacterium]